jgi:environmental stress-induced protein Ves
VTVHRFNAAQLPRTPWKNGGGTTREIISSPRGATLDTFVWRVSIADVSTSGRFSVFEGVDRVLVLLEGNGVELRGADGRVVHRLDTPLVPFTFSGDDEITSTLLAGTSVDFNVMTRRSAARADVRVVRAREELAALATYCSGVLFGARGEWTVSANDAEPIRFEPGDGCWWDGEAIACRVAPESSDAVLLAIGIRS